MPSSSLPSYVTDSSEGEQELFDCQSQEDLHVPEEVVKYAEQYQQGGEGSSRPPTATPSMLQKQRYMELPVPAGTAQLAQHFVAGEAVGRAALTTALTGNPNI
eukprot:gene3676-3937_t